MKSRFLILVPIILLAIFLIPLTLLRNEVRSKLPADQPAPGSPVEAMAVAKETRQQDGSPGYTFAEASPDGIGKIFMGREISQVMGHPGIGWLERSEREKEEAPSNAIALLDLSPETVIADIGAGSGYYSFRIAPKVPLGKVIAVDIQQEMLTHLSAGAARLALPNVEPHLGAVDSIKLPPGTLDAALLVDSYHEFSHPAEMLASLHTALKSGGTVYLLEYRAEDPAVPIKHLHKMTEAQARKEFQALGFEFVENIDSLPWQHLLVFRKP
ncbi:class I SAM-dependent methyltransferase [Luteolibacter algae]|uniref:Class I SAM-dependent methyltransferase n=1 Tax=Luteolibacter algae TaxID=454151 RepID=A0ABW5D640_9BACT